MEGNNRLYTLYGQIFFGSTESILHAFDFKDHSQNIIIDLTHAHIWDVSSVAMLDSVINKFQKNGKSIAVRGLNAASIQMMNQYSVSSIKV